MVLLGGAVFGVIAYNVSTQGPLIQGDTQFINALHVVALHSSPLVLNVMILGFYVGEHAVLVIGLILAVYFLYNHLWPELAMVVIAWAGEGALWLSLSQYFNRMRPTFEVSVWRQMQVPSFPSGHSVAAVMCYGLLAYLFVPWMTSRVGKAAVIIATLLLILYVGFSRLFVGDHYLTDVIAGLALGVAWSGLVYTSVELVAFRKKIKSKP